MAAFLVFAIVAMAQQPVAPPPAAATASPAATVAADADAPLSIDNLPMSVGRIQRALNGPPPIDLREQHPVFRLEIFGRQPTIEDILGEKFWIGPVPYAGMTHQEFMDMNTPKLLQPYAGFTGKYLVAATALTLFEQWALRSAIKHFQDAKGEHEREQARKEVLNALAALERARRAAGLDDK
jgi:hypothetical protein